MNYRLALTTIITVFLTGCVGQMPQNADEFRKELPGAFLGEVEKFEVDRSFTDIGKTFQKMAPKCLDVTIKSTSQTSTSYQVIVTKWNPTVKVTKQKAELHIQQLHEQGVMNVYKVPPGGYYMMVVDATPTGENKSQVTMYRSSVGNDTLVKAIKGWASGKNLGCPDLTK